MAKTAKTIICTFFVVFITVTLSFMLPFVSHFTPELLDKLQIENACADVSDFDIEGGEIVYLTGEWEFYQNKYIVTGDESFYPLVPDLYITVPSSWTTCKINGENLPNGGYASYRALIKGVPENEPVVITVPNMPGNYSVFADGVLVSSNCRDSNGKITNDEGYLYSKPVLLNYSEDGLYEIVIEVSCEYSAGITTLPVLSTYDASQSSIMSQLSVRYMFIGVVIFFTIAAVVFTVLMKGEINLFWLIVLCLSFFLRMLISNEGYFVSHELFMNLNYEIMTSVVFASTYVIKLATFLHLQKSLSLKVPQHITIGFGILFLICALVPVYSYQSIYVADFFNMLQAVPYILDIYVVYKLCEAVINKVEFAKIYLVGYCITTLALIIDNFYFNGFIAANVSYIMPLSFVIYIAIIMVIHIFECVSDRARATEAANLSTEIAELNNTLMLSQIQPHFLYNALNTIKYLIRKDPRTAETAVVKFSSYLRANMDSLTQREPIPIEKEIDHVKNYTEIEKLRFGQRLEVLYDIRCSDFKVPPLTVQPIVENAIKHGVNQKPEGGTVKIETYGDENFYYIKISDDGVGFDINAPLDSSKSHVGISNIKERLKTLLDADVDIKSVIGEGSEIVIKIPVREENLNENNGGR